MTHDQLSFVFTIAALVGVLFGAWVFKELAERAFVAFDDWRAGAQNRRRDYAVRWALGRALSTVRGGSIGYDGPESVLNALIKEYDR